MHGPMNVKLLRFLLKFITCIYFVLTVNTMGVFHVCQCSVLL